MNKKANAILDTLVVVVILFVLGIIVVFGNKILTEVNSDIQADASMSNDSKKFIGDMNTQYPTLFDGIFLFILVGSWICSIIFSFMIDTHPIFIVISIILLIVILFAAALLANSYSDITSDSSLATYAVNYPNINFVMSHIVQVVLVIAATIMIALFAKSRLA